LNVSPEGESWVWSARNGETPNQADQHEKHAMNQDLPTTTLYRHG
jgi:hypothetical protein